MDNRRVMKAYRDRSREKVLPYPSRGNLLSRVKRYFSAGEPPVANKVQHSRSTTQPIPASANKSVLPRVESFSVTVNDSVAEGDHTTNRILSSFFQEKGDRPLTQIEYEGVMSLLEKSKASITLPLPESPENEGAPEDDTAIESRQNQTFAPYSQKVLRNSSVLDANSTTLATPDYRPVYHTFSDTSRGNTSVKRVYQFSGLPSPYRTRIRAPNLNARRAQRITTADKGSAVSTGVSTGASTAGGISTGPSTEDRNDETQDSVQKKLSNTANSLYSILDKGTAEAPLEFSSTTRPLHNPFARSKRKTPISLESPAKRSALGASDISKTVLHNKVEELDEKKEGLDEKKETTTFSFGKYEDAIANATENNKTDEKRLPDAEGELDVKKTEEDKTEEKSRSQKPFNSLFGNSQADTNENGQSKPSLFNTALPKFNFGEKLPVQPAPSSTAFSFSAKKDESKASAENGSATFSFGKSMETESASSNGFTFGSKKAEEKPVPLPALNNVESINLKTSLERPREPVSSFGAFASKNDDKIKLEKPLFSFGASKTKTGDEKSPAFSFGSKPESESSRAPAFGSGSKPENVTSKLPAFSFGSKPENESTKAPAFSFGSKSENESSKPLALNFGSKPANETKTPAFSFGSKPANESSKAPAFSFGSKPENESTKTPAFSFGSKPENGSSKAPAFNFGSKSTSEAPKPAFNLGSKPVEAPKASAFSFGIKPDTNTTAPEPSKDAKPAFSFGSTEAKTPAFSFGKPSVPTFGAKTGSGNANGASNSDSSSNTPFGNKGTGSNGADAGGLFEFPPVKVVSGQVDDAKVEQYKSLFKF